MVAKDKIHKDGEREGTRRKGEIGRERGRKGKSWKVSFAKEVLAAPGAVGRGRVEGEEFTHQRWSVWNCLQHEGPEGVCLHRADFKELVRHSSAAIVNNA